MKQTLRATDWLRRYAPLAAFSLLFGALGPFARFIGITTKYLLGQPAWPTIIGGVLGCVACVVCVRAPASKALHALIGCVCVLAAPLLCARWVPGLIIVGAVGVTVFIPMLTVAIALSRTPARDGAAGLSALALIGPAASLVTALLFRPRLVLVHVTETLALGAIALAGSASAAWLLPWPPKLGETTSVPATTHPVWLSVGRCVLLAASASLDIDAINRLVGAWPLYLMQAVGLPTAAALCILPVSPSRRAGLYLAATLAGRLVGSAVSVGVEWLAR